MDNSNQSNNDKKPKIIKNNLFKSVDLDLILKIIGILIIILVIFQAGVFVGYKKSEFSKHWGDNYSIIFGERRGIPGMPFIDDLTPAHGVTGKIIKIDLPSFIVEGTDNIEKSVLIKDDTSIRQSRSNFKASDLKVGDFVIVIGAPDQNGQIEAELIRITPVLPIK